MDENEIHTISSKDYSKVSEVLKEFLVTNESQFSFPHLSENNMRVSLWAALFEHLQVKSSESIHTICLSALRILSRDKTEVENLICERWMITLIEKAGLYNFIDPGEAVTENEMPSKEIAVEALKCLCNIAFNSEVARALCAHTSIAHGLVARLRSYNEIPYKEDIMLFDMKLIFILTALRQDIRATIKNELNGMEHITNCLGELVLEATEKSNEAVCSGKPHIRLSEKQQVIACEILKTQFNMMYHSGPDEHVSAEEEAICRKLMPILTLLLMAETATWDKLMELHSNIANLLTSVPPEFYDYLSPKCDEGEPKTLVFNGCDMEAIHSLLQLMQHRLTITTSTLNQYENLSPILTVLNKSARSVRVQRKYLRQTVLPPLRDVSRPPEKGSTIRNQLCRLLTTPVTSVRDLVAEFLFILCKEKVGRMVKYTGFGNAAGHLAQKGLMCGGRGPVQYSSSSEDSDTEEYIEAQPHIDPVVGCTRPPRANPFENMTEEQKEFEAMKLVNLFDKMLAEGVVKPATIGADGKPRAVEHVLEVRERPPTRTQS